MRIIGGSLRGRALAAPQTQDIRPGLDRVRENVFNILSARLGGDFSDKRVLDLFAGTGAYGLEALSRGAKAAVFVDTGAEARGLLRQNIENFALGGAARILRRDACDLGLLSSGRPFNILFADPPYNHGLGEKAFAAALAGGWLHNNATLILEESAKAVISLPAPFVPADERIYGRTVIRFFTLSL